MLIGSEMSRPAIFYPQLLQPTCVLPYLPRSRRWCLTPSLHPSCAGFFLLQGEENRDILNVLISQGTGGDGGHRRLGDPSRIGSVHEGYARMCG